MRIVSIMSHGHCLETLFSYTLPRKYFSSRGRVIMRFKPLKLHFRNRVLFNSSVQEALFSFHYI